MIFSARWIASCLIVCTFFSKLTKSDSILTKRNVQILPYTTDDCGQSSLDPIASCLIVCPKDLRCQDLGFNHSIPIVSCNCPSQFCPDGRIYFFTNDYTKSIPLNDSQLFQEPYVIAPCGGCVPAEIAPYYEQIGTCSRLNRTENQGCH